MVNQLLFARNDLDVGESPCWCKDLGAKRLFVVFSSYCTVLCPLALMSILHVMKLSEIACYSLLKVFLAKMFQLFQVISVNRCISSKCAFAYKHCLKNMTRRRRTQNERTKIIETQTGRNVMKVNCKQKLRILKRSIWLTAGVFEFINFPARSASILFMSIFGHKFGTLKNPQLCSKAKSHKLHDSRSCDSAVS